MRYTMDNIVPKARNISKRRWAGITVTYSNNRTAYHVALDLELSGEKKVTIRLGGSRKKSNRNATFSRKMDLQKRFYTA